LLAAAEARAAASMNDLGRMRELIGKARGLLKKNDHDDFAHIHSFYDQTEFTSYEGLCHLNLGSYTTAETLLRQGAAELLTQRGADYQRNLTMKHARLALAQLGQSNVTDAAATGAAVLSTAPDGALSTRTLEAVRSLAGGFAPYGHLAAVRSFQEQLRSVAKGEGSA
jgi:hypothetical protein